MIFLGVSPLSFELKSNRNAKLRMAGGGNSGSRCYDIVVTRGR